MLRYQAGRTCPCNCKGSSGGCGVYAARGSCEVEPRNCARLCAITPLKNSVQNAGLTNLSPSNLGASKTKSKVFHCPSGRQGFTIGGYTPYMAPAPPSA